MVNKAKKKWKGHFKYERERAGSQGEEVEFSCFVFLVSGGNLADLPSAVWWKQMWNYRTSPSIRPTLNTGRRSEVKYFSATEEMLIAVCDWSLQSGAKSHCSKLALCAFEQQPATRRRVNPFRIGPGNQRRRSCDTGVFGD